MKEKDPIDPILDELSKLLDFAESKAGTPLSNEPLPADFNLRIAALQEMVKKFAEMADEEVRTQGLSTDKLVDRVLGKDEELPKEDQRVLEKALRVGQHAMGLKYALEMARDRLKNHKSKNFDASKASDKEAKKRKSKFKKIRGDQTWKKL